MERIFNSLLVIIVLLTFCNNELLSNSYNSTAIKPGIRKKYSFEVTKSINEKISPVRFKIVGYTNDDIFSPKNLLLFRGNSYKPFQSFKIPFNCNPEWYGDKISYLKFIDLNFDGYLDLRIFDNSGSGGEVCHTFLIDPGTGKYLYNNELTQLGVFFLDYKNKQITYYYRCGGWDNYLVKYAVKGIKLCPLVSYHNESWDGGNLLHTTKYIYKNDKFLRKVNSKSKHPTSLYYDFVKNNKDLVPVSSHDFGP